MRVLSAGGKPYRITSIFPSSTPAARSVLRVKVGREISSNPFVKVVLLYFPDEVRCDRPVKHRGEKGPGQLERRTRTHQLYRHFVERSPPQLFFPGRPE